MEKNPAHKDNFFRVFIDNDEGQLINRADGEDGYLFTLSTAKRDRHGTVILPTAWDVRNYNKNPIVAWMHHTSDDYWLMRASDPDDIIGYGSAQVQENELVGRLFFEPEDINPQAEKIRKKIDFGSIRAVSVGFQHVKGHWGIEEDGEDTGTYYFDQVELLEFSVVTIPSNPEALKKSWAEMLEKIAPKPKIEEKTVSVIGDNNTDTMLVSIADRRNRILKLQSRP